MAQAPSGLRNELIIHLIYMGGGDAFGSWAHS